MGSTEHLLHTYLNEWMYDEILDVKLLFSNDPHFIKLLWGYIS